jgi:2-polyprenyl-3-methyl-5-hydroxy-6-metoxy-1,4-benzoquinol methylase
MPKVRSKGFSNPAKTWDARFASSDYIFGKEPNVWLAQHADRLIPGGHALAVADGEGRNSVWLAERGMQVDAFDISPVGVEKARQLALTAGALVNFSVSDCDDWNWQSNHYDVVAAIFIQFADPETRTRLFRNMMESLKPGGVLLLQGYTPKQLDYKTGGPPLLSHLYTEELLRTEFSEMEIIELRSYEEVLREGTQHSGQSALIGLVAKKR